MHAFLTNQRTSTARRATSKGCRPPEKVSTPSNFEEREREREREEKKREEQKSKLQTGEETWTTLPGRNRCTERGLGGRWGGGCGALCPMQISGRRGL